MVPNGWELATVGELFEVKLGKMLNKAAKEQEPQFPYFGNSDVRWGFLNKSELKTMYFSEKERAKFTLVKGDILLCEGGEVGRCAIWQHEESNIYYQKALHRLRTKGQIVPEYFQLFMAHINDTRLLEGYTTKTSIAHLTREKLIELPVKTPPLPEQRKIAQILSTWNKAITTTEKLINVSKQQKKSLMQQLLTGKKRLRSSPKDGAETGKAFEGEWEYVRAGNIFSTRSNKKHNSDLPILAITQDQGAIPRELIDYKVSVTNDSISGYKVVEQGDFIISLRSFQGGIEYSRYRGICSPAYVILYPKIEIVDAFFIYHLKSHPFIQAMKSRLEGIRDGKIISYKYFSEIKLPQPSLVEQQQIASVLAASDKEIAVLEAKLAHFKQEKKALMQQLLTGKRRVKIDEVEAA